MNESEKAIIDMTAGATTAAAWLNLMPDAVALLTGIWVIIRIWETETVRKLTNRRNQDAEADQQ